MRDTHYLFVSGIAKVPRSAQISTSESVSAASTLANLFRATSACKFATPETRSCYPREM